MHILGTLMLIICLAGYALGSCPPDEYPVGSECCPLCRSGKNQISELFSTKCSSCPDGTFQAGNNKEKQCSTCTKCDAGLGLKVKKSCTSTSDAVCEVLDGFFCSDSNRGGCRTAQRHRLSCSPGHYIGQRGTADKDTQCLHCTDGTFSDGTSTSCQNHTKCESVGLNLMRPGTDSTDSECGEHGPEAGLVAGVISGVMLVMALMALIIGGLFLYKKRGNPAPPSSLSHNGSVLVSVHQEDDPIVSPSSDKHTITVNGPSVHFKSENGAA
uniref:TNFR-Cys domain-containing protein n=1 Tax=Gadus morhua TaxID=8049 RepID=A0A8C4YZ29_GADMO